MRRPGTSVRRRQFLGVVAAACAGMTPALPQAASSTVLIPWNRPNTPALAAADLNGRPRTLAEFSGKVVLLNFWATYCAPCLVEIPSLNRLAERFRGRGFELVGINHGEMPGRVRRFVQQVPFDGVMLLDRSMSELQRWGSDALPTSVVIDRQGRARFLHTGELDWDRPEVSAQVATLL